MAVRIAIVTTRHSPDDDRIYFKEAISLRKVYSEIAIVAPASADSENFNGSGIQLLSLSRTKGRLGRLRDLISAFRRVRAWKPDVVHVHDFDLVPFGALSRFLHRCKTIYDAHEFFPESIATSLPVPEWGRRFVQWTLERFEYFFAGQVDLVITPVESLSERFILQGLPTVTLLNYPRTEFLLKESGRGGGPEDEFQGRPIVLYQGTLSEERGIRQAIRAMGLMREKRPDALLVLVGARDEAEVEQYERFARELKVEGSVHVVPWIGHREVFRYVHRATIGLIPFLPLSQYTKAIPIKLFEYMGCGIPVLGSDLPPIARFIESSGAGRLYDPWDVQALANHALEMIADDKGWKRMSEAGLKAVQERWNWSQMEKRMLESYAALDDGERTFEDSHVSRM